MKKGMHKVENSGLNGEKRRSGFLTCEWMSGFGMMVIGQILHIVVLPFCDLVVLSTDTAQAILFSNLLSVLYLKEKFLWRFDGPAMFLIVIGSIIIVSLSNYNESVYTPDDIIALLTSTVSITSFASAIVVSAATIIQYLWHLRKLRTFNEKANKYIGDQLAEMQADTADNRLQEFAADVISQSGQSIEEIKSRERPQRLLIKVIQGFSYDLISEIDPYTAKYVRPIIKLPMVMILILCGMSVGMNMTCFTYLGELLQSGTFTDAPFLILFIGCFCTFCSLVLLFVTNFVVSIYDHLDVMPTNYSVQLIFTVFCGLTLLGEA